MQDSNFNIERTIGKVINCLRLEAFYFNVMFYGPYFIIIRLQSGSQTRFWSQRET